MGPIVPFLYHLIIDLSRFGEARDRASQKVLMAQLQELGISEVAGVYAAGDTAVRHFVQTSCSFLPDF
jgi:hypothetical protein